MRDLVAEVDGSPVSELNIAREKIGKAKKAGLPILTVGSIMNNMKFGPQVPEEMKKLILVITPEAIIDSRMWRQYFLHRQCCSSSNMTERPLSIGMRQ